METFTAGLVSVISALILGIVFLILLVAIVIIIMVVVTSVIPDKLNIFEDDQKKINDGYTGIIKSRFWWEPLIDMRSYFQTHPILILKKDYTMEENVNIQKENVLNAYKNSNDDQKKLLEALFGKAMFAAPQDVCERIKTFDDACRELGSKHPYVIQYVAYFQDKKFGEPIPAEEADLVAYLKLRIITAALNEGWEPQFTEGERRWYAWYELLTKEQYDKLPDEAKSRAVLRSSSNAYAYGGLVSASAYSDSSYSLTGCGSRLAFKSEKLAIYAAKQFIEIYANFCFIPEAE